MVDIAEKVRENRLRRQARRLGLELQKSRAKAVRVDDRGLWRIADGRSRARWGRRWELTWTRPKRSCGTWKPRN